MHRAPRACHAGGVGERIQNLSRVRSDEGPRLRVPRLAAPGWPGYTRRAAESRRCAGSPPRDPHGRDVAGWTGARQHVPIPLSSHTPARARTHTHSHLAGVDQGGLFRLDLAAMRWTACGERRAHTHAHAHTHTRSHWPAEVYWTTCGGSRRPDPLWSQLETRIDGHYRQRSAREDKLYSC